jgi:hypothetical protein
MKLRVAERGWAAVFATATAAITTATASAERERRNVFIDE